MSKKTILPTSIKIPSRGDRVKAKDIQHLATQIKRVSRAGRENYVGAFYRAPDAPFTPKLRGKKDDPQAYEIALSKGYVVERKISGESAIIYHTPTGIKDGAGDPVWHEITDGECLYVKLQVDNRGVVTGDPTVEVAEDDLAGEHSRPEVFDYDGNEGEHNYKICKFEIVDDKPRLKLFSAGDNIDHFSERVGMRNLDGDGGTSYQIGKDYDDSEDSVSLRSLLQLTGTGMPIIRPYGEGGAGNTVDFRLIKNRDPSASLAPQIFVEAEPEDSAILIRGNGIEGENPYMVVVDGLVTEVKSEGSTPDGIDFVLFFSMGDGSSQLVLTWEKGALVTATYESVDASTGGVVADAVSGG
jgi:hypothetical protein